MGKPVNNGQNVQFLQSLIADLQNASATPQECDIFRPSISLIQSQTAVEGTPAEALNEIFMSPMGPGMLNESRRPTCVFKFELIASRARIVGV